MYKGRSPICSEEEKIHLLYYTLHIPQEILFKHSCYTSVKMFFQTFLLLALSITALSLPNTKNLEQRHKSVYGWVGNFDDADTFCTGAISGARPKFEISCSALTPSTQRIGTWNRFLFFFILSLFAHARLPPSSAMMMTMTPRV